MVVGFREAGVDLAALCRRVGLEPDALDYPIATPQAHKLFTLAFEAVGDPSFGLTLGEKIRPELFGVVGFAAMSAPTYGGALTRVARYKQLVTGDRVEILPKGAVTAVRLRLTHPEMPHARQQADGQLAFVVAFGRALTGHPIRPEQVSVQFPRPIYHARYAAVFGCPIVYDAPENEVVLRTVDLELPLMSSNPELVIMFEEKAEEFRAASDVEPELANRVRTVLQRMMRGELPDLGGVARALSISERSLQRKLGQEGVSFQHLVNEVRFSLAQRHLRNREVDAAEVSYLLGFSHPTSFYRAFKRWTGMTPEEYRRSSPAEEPRRRLDA